MLTLSFSIAVKYLLHPRDLRFRRRRMLRDGISAILAVCNCACVIARVKPEINLKTIFSNTQHYVRCMPSRYALDFIPFLFLLKKKKEKSLSALFSRYLRTVAAVLPQSSFSQEFMVAHKYIPQRRWATIVQGLRFITRW